MLRFLLAGALVACGLSLAVANPAAAHVPHDDIRSLVVSPAFSRDRTLFIVARGNVFRSVDGGYRWRRLSRGLPCSQDLGALAISPTFARDETLFVSCRSGGLFRSRDRGGSWQPVDGGLGRLVAAAIAPSPAFADDGVALLATEDGHLFRTADSGGTWTRIEAITSAVSAIAWSAGRVVVGAGDGSLHLSTDSGVGWHEHVRTSFESPVTAIEWPRSVLDRQKFYVGTAGGGVHEVSFDAAQTRVAPHGLTGLRVTSLASAEHDGRVVLLAATDNEAVYRFDPAVGDSWVLHDDGIEKNAQADAYGLPHFAVVRFADDGTAMLAGFCGFFRSEDAGRGWRRFDVTFGHITLVAVSPAQGSQYSVAIGTYGSGPLISEDSGHSWRISTTGLTITRVGPLAFSPAYVRDRTIVGGTYSRAFRSEDAGETWQTSRMSPAEGSMQALKTKLFGSWDVPTWYERIAALAGPFYVDSPDLAPSPLAVAFSPSYQTDRTLFLGMHPNGVLRSRDGGNSFALVWGAAGRRVNSLVVSPQFASEPMLLASTADGLFRSRDAGESWHSVGPAELAGASLVFSPSYVQDATVFAGSTAGLFKTTDGATSWQRLSLGDDHLPVASLAISPNFREDRRLLVQLRGGDLLLCEDTATHFKATATRAAESGIELSQLIDRDRGALIAFSPNYGEDRTVYGGSGEDLVKSLDDGETWQRIARPLRYEAESTFRDWFLVPMRREGSWQRRTCNACSGEFGIHASAAGSTLHMSFVGTGVRWLGARGPDLGIATVLIDGDVRDSVDQYAASQDFMVPSFTVDDLASGPHTIEIRVEGRKHLGSSAADIFVDAFDVTSGD